MTYYSFYSYGDAENPVADLHKLRDIEVTVVYSIASFQLWFYILKVWNLEEILSY